MAIQYVGGQTTSRVGTTSAATVTFALTGGLASVPAAGDLVIITVVVGSQARNPPLAITGYTALTQLLGNGTTYDTSLDVSYKFMGTTPDTSFTLPSTGNTADGQALTIQVFRGVDSTTPLDVTPTSATGTATSRPNPPAITPLTAGAWIVVCSGGACSSSGTYTYAGLTAVLTNTASDTNDAAVGSGYVVWTSGTYDPAAATTGSALSGDSWAAYTLALRPQGTTDLSSSQDEVASATDVATRWLTSAATQVETATATDATSGSIPSTEAPSAAFATGAVGAWLDVRLQDLIINTDGTGGAITSWGSVFGRWLDRSGNGDYVASASAAERVTAVDPGDGTHYVELSAPRILGAAGGGSSTAFYFGFALAQYGGWVGTIFTDVNTVNTGIRVAYSPDTGDVTFSAGTGTGRAQVSVNAEPAGNILGKHYVDGWYEAGYLNIRLDKGTVAQQPCSGISAGTAAFALAAEPDNTAGFYSHWFQAVFTKDYVPSATDRDNIADFSMQKAGLSVPAGSMTGTDTETAAAADAQSVSLTAVRSIIEAGTAADSATVAASIGRTVAEAAAAVDSSSAAAAMARTSAEAAAATEAVTVAAASTAANAEPATASDTTNRLLSAAAALVETAAATDLTGVSIPGSTLAETAAAADVQSVSMNMAVGVVETAAAAHTQSVSFTAVLAVAESSGASEATSVTVAVPQLQQSESTAASDSTSVAVGIPALLMAEPAVASDLAVVNMSTARTSAENTAATDVVLKGLLAAGAQQEPATATDLYTIQRVGTGLQEEPAAAADSQSVSQSGSAIQAEAATGVDEQVASAGAASLTSIEVANATDFTSVTLHTALVQAESTAATDIVSVSFTATPSIAEVALAADSTSTGTGPVSISEIAAAADQQDVFFTATKSTVEAAAAVDAAVRGLLAAVAQQEASSAFDDVSSTSGTLLQQAESAIADDQLLSLLAAARITAETAPAIEFTSTILRSDRATAETVNAVDFVSAGTGRTSAQEEPAVAGDEQFVIADMPVDMAELAIGVDEAVSSMLANADIEETGLADDSTQSGGATIHSDAFEPAFAEDDAVSTVSSNRGVVERASATDTVSASQPPMPGMGKRSAQMPVTSHEFELPVMSHASYAQAEYRVASKPVTDHIFYAPVDRDNVLVADASTNQAEDI